MATFEEIKKANETIGKTEIKGKEYAEVNQRIKAFRMVYPNGSISTEIVTLENGVVTMKSSVMNEDGVLIGTGYAQEKESSSFINKTSYIENCETSAVGRALGMCGFGIDTSICSAEELKNALENQNPKKEKTTQEPSAELMKEHAVLVANMDSYSIDFRDKHNKYILEKTGLKTQDISKLSPTEIKTLNKFYNQFIKAFKQQKGV